MDLIRIIKWGMRFYSGYYSFWFLLIPGIIYLVLLVIGGLGLYTMASRHGLKYKWRAFIPFANTYLLGVLAGDKCMFFGARMKRIRLWLTISDVIAAIVGAFSVFCLILICSPFYTDVRQAIDGTLYFDEKAMTSTQKIFYNGYTVSSCVYYFLELVYIVFFVSALLSVFRRYAPAQSMMFTLISVIFPVESVFLLAVCKNKEVNYNDYIRARYARYRNQRGYYNPPPPRNPPSGSNNRGNRSGYNYDPYTGKPINHNEKKDDDPFPEFNSDKKDGGSSGNSSGGSDPFDL